MLNAKNEKINTNNTTEYTTAEYNDNRTYVEVSEEVKIYPQDLGFEPAGEDEVFVPIEPIENRWISNYGRLVYYNHSSAKVANGSMHHGKRVYSITNARENKKINFSADKAVYCAFSGDWSMFFNKDYSILHLNNDEEDCYFKNLRLVTLHQSKVLKKKARSGEDISLYLDNDMNKVPSVFNVGYWGIDDVDTSSISYKRWQQMLRRCYSEEYLQKKPSYRECRVCDEWLCYGNFKAWFDKNWYETDKYEMQLDKDILVKGNKVYSPDTCAFVPKQLNTMILTSQATRGRYPLGVIKSGDRFSAECRVNNKTKTIGTYDTVEEAFNAYKEYKEGFIKKITERYKGKIPDKVYDALMNWKIEITD